MKGIDPNTRVLETDEKASLQLISSAIGPLWVSRFGEHHNGRELLVDLTLDHERVAQAANPSYLVKSGDVVIDCGGHVGVFTAVALARGASKVLTVEPDPTNLECLRRNFPTEIANGRVVIFPGAVWNKRDVLTFESADQNSGMGSVAVARRTGRTFQVEATTLDELVQRFGLSRVDYIKMDIEGAERFALEGAQETLRNFRPTLMLDSYHRPDDMRAFRSILEPVGFSPQYVGCRSCDQSPLLTMPRVTFWQKSLQR